MLSVLIIETVFSLGVFMLIYKYDFIIINRIFYAIPLH
jgi:hypothetical protein